MSRKTRYIDTMLNRMIRSTADYYHISIEKACRLYLISTVRQMEYYENNKMGKCSPFASCFDKDFDPSVDCSGDMGPLYPNC